MKRFIAWVMIYSGIIGLLLTIVIRDDIFKRQVSGWVIFVITGCYTACGVLLLYSALQDIPLSSFIRKLLGKASTYVGIGLIGVSGILWPMSPIGTQPLLSNFGIDPSAPDGAPGHTDPIIAGPGDTVTLTVDEGPESLLGMWKCKRLDVKAWPTTPKQILWQPENVSTMPEDKTWDTSKDYFTGPGIPSRFLIENRKCAPWIRFRIPDNPQLRGISSYIAISMDILYPQADRVFYNNYEYSVDYRKILFKIATEDEILSYSKWRSANSYWEKSNKAAKFGIGISAIIGIISLIIAFNGIRVTK
jgi:hypothetical protein